MHVHVHECLLLNVYHSEAYTKPEKRARQEEKQIFTAVFQVYIFLYKHQQPLKRKEGNMPPPKPVRKAISIELKRKHNVPG